MGFYTQSATDAARRRFLGTTAAGVAIASASEFAFLQKLRPLQAEELKLPPNAVQFNSHIEPLVRLLEETPRERVLEAFAAKIQSGTSYQDVLAALLLAGVRNIQPRPAVGFKFHAVLVVNSAHLASLASADQDRWLPIFWALDYFKSAQATDVREGDWTLAAVDEAKIPPPHRARQAFEHAMESWDVEAADVAVAALARSASSHQIFDIFAYYGCRDFRSIGHKAIYVANSFRTLECIGWQYAEPVLRSLAYALLNHTGEPNPSKSDLEADRAWRNTTELVAEKSWQGEKHNDAVTRDLVSQLRTCSPSEAVSITEQLLREGTSSQAIADALYLSSAELLTQQPGIVSLHSATSTNAMQYAFRTAASEKTRQSVMLQNAAFIPYFREAMRDRGSVDEKTLQLTEIEYDQTTESPAINDIFEQVSKDRKTASAQLRQALDRGTSAESVMEAARRLVFLKGTDSHDYKFSSAVLEDYYAVSPQFRSAYLSAAAFLLPGALDKDNSLVDRTRSALG